MPGDSGPFLAYASSRLHIRLIQEMG